MGTSFLPPGDQQWNRTPIRWAFFVFIFLTILSAAISIAETAKLSHTISILVLSASLVTTLHLAVDMYYFFIVGRLHGASVFILFFAEFCLWAVVDLSEAVDLGFLSRPKGWFNTGGPFPKCGFGHHRTHGGVCDLMRARFFISLLILVFSFAFTMFSALAPAHGISPVSDLANGGTEGGGDGEHAQRSPDQESGQAQPEDKALAQPVVQNV